MIRIIQCITLNNFKNANILNTYLFYQLLLRLQEQEQLKFLNKLSGAHEKPPLRMENKNYLNDIFEQSLGYLTSLSVNSSAIMLYPRRIFAICMKLN